MGLRFVVLTGFILSSFPAVAAGQMLRADARTVDITIDGRMGEADWMTTEVARFTDTGSVSDNRAAVRALWDDVNLYVYWEVLDNFLSVSGAPEIWRDDGVELWVDTAENRSMSTDADDFHVIYNIDEVRLLQRGDGMDLEGSLRVTAAVARVGTGFGLELAVSWSDMSVTPTDGQSMGMLVANNDRDGPTYRQYAWTGQRDFSLPDMWGTLVLSGMPVPTDAGAMVVDSGAPAPDGGAVLDGGAPADGGAATMDASGTALDAGAETSARALVAHGSGLLCATGTGTPDAPLSFLLLLAASLLRRCRRAPTSRSSRRGRGPRRSGSRPPGRRDSPPAS